MCRFEVPKHISRLEELSQVGSRERNVVEKFNVGHDSVIMCVWYHLLQTSGCGVASFTDEERHQLDRLVQRLDDIGEVRKESILCQRPL